MSDQNFDLVGAFARHVVSTRFADLPAGAVGKAKTFLLDTLGVALAGTAGANVAALSDVASGWGAGAEATVWGSGLKLPAPSAALVNAYLIHCQEFDCVHEGAVVHPMAAILSALTAWSEREAGRGRPVPGGVFLSALAVGVDIAALLGMATTAPVRFFRPATASGFGAVAAIAHAAGFDETKVKDAFGALYGQTSGTLQPHVEGSVVLGLQIGFNARAAITAIDLAEAGLRGPHDVLTGPYGYFTLFEQGSFDAEVVRSELGRVWQIARLAHKPFPSGRLTHGVVDGLKRLMAREGFAPDDIASVTAHVPPLVNRLVGRPDRPDPPANYAKLCLAHVAGIYLARGRVDIPDFSDPANLVEPRAHDFAARVTIVEDGNPDLNALAPQRIVVRLTGGAVHAVDLPQVYGHPDAALSEAENRDKFRRCCGHARPPVPDERAAAIEAAVSGFETLADSAALVRLLVSC